MWLPREVVDDLSADFVHLYFCSKNHIHTCCAKVYIFDCLNGSHRFGRGETRTRSLGQSLRHLESPTPGGRCPACEQAEAQSCSCPIGEYMSRLHGSIGLYTGFDGSWPGVHGLHLGPALHCHRALRALGLRQAELASHGNNQCDRLCDVLRIELVRSTARWLAWQGSSNFSGCLPSAVLCLTRSRSIVCHAIFGSHHPCCSALRATTEEHLRVSA